MSWSKQLQELSIPLWCAFIAICPTANHYKAKCEILYILCSYSWVLWEQPSCVTDSTPPREVVTYRPRKNCSDNSSKNSLNVSHSLSLSWIPRIQPASRFFSGNLPRTFSRVTLGIPKQIQLLQGFPNKIVLGPIPWAYQQIFLKF